MFPEAFLERMGRRLGCEYEEFLKALEGEPFWALRLNSLKVGAQGKTAAEAFGPGRKARDLPEGTEGFLTRLMPVPWAENGYYYEAGQQPGKHPYHEAGLYYIQEPSAMAPAELLGVIPGDRVLDLCAAPGGKSTQLAAKLQGKGFLLSNEIHPARAKILSENVERMGIRNACVTNETPERLSVLFLGFFDKILVDAPCSGEGMFRKNEAACEEWSPENVTLCAARQDGILDCAAKMLRPGGRLVYSTCTFSAEENEGSVERFLSRHPDFKPVPLETENTGLQGCAGELTGTVRLMPHKVRGEGHFAAVLEREGGIPEESEEGADFADPSENGLKRAVDGVMSAAICREVKGLSEKELGDYLSFCRENLRCDVRCGRGMGHNYDMETGGNLFQEGGPGNTRYIRFGDNLYLMPGDMPDLKGVRALRPGLHLGELKKNRFEPSHALALALSPGEVIHVCNFSAQDQAVSAYLRGQTFPAEGEKGWYLICVDGFSIGWGKLAGGVMKNHYPRGLRRNA